MYNTCCKILGIKPGSDINTIKSAYRKAAKELHPDVNHLKNAGEYFNILQNAYQYLLEHPFRGREIIIIKSKVRFKRPINHNEELYRRFRAKTSPFAEKTLREILAGSFIARIVFIFFHILFLITGIILIFNSVYDMFFCALDPRVSAGSAYITIVFGFIFGIVITLIFTASGINFISRR